MNEIIASAKSGRGKGNRYAKEKRAWTDSVALLAKVARLPRVGRVRLRFLWTEVVRRRDPDNIAAARKFILDGLVAAGVLPGDGWAYIAGFQDDFVLGARAGVEVTLEPVA